MFFMSTIHDFKVGSLVRHNSYGHGSIINIDDDGEKCTILFDDGFKERFTIENLIRSSNFSVLSRKRERISDLFDWD